MEFTPYPERPRIAEEEWHGWAEKLPAIGQAFEVVIDGKTVTAMRRQIAEMRECLPGTGFYVEVPMIVSRENEFIGFVLPPETRWRYIDIILQPWW